MPLQSNTTNYPRIKIARLERILWHVRTNAFRQVTRYTRRALAFYFHTIIPYLQDATTRPWVLSTACRNVTRRAKTTNHLQNRWKNPKWSKNNWSANPHAASIIPSEIQRKLWNTKMTQKVKSQVFRVTLSLYNTARFESFPASSGAWLTPAWPWHALNLFYYFMD